MLGLTGYSFEYRTSQKFASVQPEVFYWDPPNSAAGKSVTNRARLYDAVDLVWRNRVGETHNINAQLGRVKARTLVMHITNDQWLNFRLAERAVERIPGADLIAEESPISHYGVFSIINSKHKDPKFASFMNDVDRLNRAQEFRSKTYRTPVVQKGIETGKSFWSNYVTYPFPVKFANVKGPSGTTWNIGYMDEYAGSNPNPNTLVILHGKGAFGAHYGNVMKLALQRGLRVIVPDLPHYGMSGPGNLNKNPARSMQEMRDVVHALVVDQLGVKRAAYMGHSLGGQMALGYALSWPDAVQSLILEAPAGLEEYPRDIRISATESAPLFDASLAKDFQKWKAVWDKTGALASEISRSEEGVRDFFYFKKRDPLTGAVISTRNGYFMNDSEYARLHTEQRVGLIKGSREELEQWVNVYIYDIYGMVVELQKSDPDNLYQRLTKIKAPIFLSFGDKEPFIPGTALNGLKDLGRDIITPFMSRMTIAGNRPVLKIYPDTGHFIHTDNPVEFASDVVDFVSTGTVDTSSPLSIDRLINGKTASVVAKSETPAGDAPTAGLNK